MSAIVNDMLKKGGQCLCHSERAKRAKNLVPTNDDPALRRTRPFATLRVTSRTEGLSKMLLTAINFMESVSFVHS
jgi:hypothetical protein